MTLKTIAASSAAVLLTLATAACRPGPTIYQAKGVIQEVSPEQKKVKIAHEKIPGYMDAMTMLLDVKQADELKGLQPGDQVSFRMLVTDNDGWIDQLKKLDLPPAPVAEPEPSPFRRVREVEPLAVGDAMP